MRLLTNMGLRHVFLLKTVALRLRRGAAKQWTGNIENIEKERGWMGPCMWSTRCRGQCPSCILP